jgi:copper chaperone CopZ
MKKILFVFAILAFAASNLSAQFKSASLQAAGLTCAMCTKAINNAVEELSFVKKVDVDIKSSTFLIDFREGANVDVDALKKAVEDAGFSVSRLKLKGNFENIAIKNDAHVEIGGKTFHFLNVKDQTLNGESVLTMVDKNYVSAKEFKKYSAATKMECIQTGKASSCCKKEAAETHTRIYHVTVG